MLRNFHYFVGGIPRSDVPQIVTIVFSGMVDGDFLKLHNQSFPTYPPKDRRNPNQCPMATTIFVRGKRTDFCAVNRLYAYGHEIGQNGIALRNEDFWSSESQGEFTKDLKQLNDYLVEDAKVPRSKIYGTRSPVLEISDAYLYVAEELDFEYDSSIILRSNVNNGAAAGTPVTFPYTLDNTFQDDDPFACSNQQCPQETVRYVTYWENQCNLLAV